MVDRADQFERLGRLLRLSTPPVAVKYFTHFNEESEWKLVEAGFYRPKTPLNVCQFIGLARHHSRSVFATEQDLACKIGALALGMYPFDEEMKEGRIALLDGARKDAKLCREMFRALPRIDPGEVKAVAFSPLNRMSLDVDQVVFYGNPLETLKIVQAYLWGEGGRLVFSTCGKYGICVEGMASSYVTGRPSIGFPCRGERTSSIVQDHELFLCVPEKCLEGIIEGLEKTEHLLPTPMPFSGVNQFPDFLPDYYLIEKNKNKRD